MSISYTIRNWANLNFRKARVLIVFIAVLLFYLSHLLGILMVSLEADPYAMFLVGTCFGILAWILAPRKKEDFPIRYSYANQQVAKVLILMSVCIGVGGGAMCLEHVPFSLEEPTSSDRSREQFEAIIGVPMFPTAKANKPLKRGVSKWFQGTISKRATKRMRAIIKKTPISESSSTGKVIATIGVLLLSLILVYLVGILSCSLSCNGQITLSYMVLIGGLGLVAFLAVSLLKTIHRKKSVDPKPDL